MANLDLPGSFISMRCFYWQVDKVEMNRSFFFLLIIRDKDSYVALKFMENNRRVRETVYGREYTISAELTQPNGTYGIKVKNCIAFNKKNISYALINEKGLANQIEFKNLIKI